MILKINGIDILPFVAQKGIKWQRNDLDGSNAGRTLDGTMHRERITSKVRLDITCLPLSSKDAQTVLNAIYPEYVEVEYTDPMYGYLDDQFTLPDHVKQPFVLYIQGTPFTLSTEL